MNTLSKGDILSLQHSVYTVVVNFEKLFYQLDYIKSLTSGRKTKDDFFRGKNQERYQYALTQFKQSFNMLKADLLNSIPHEKRYMILDSLSDDRIQALNSIDMLVNQLRDDSAIDSIEEYIGDLVDKARSDSKKTKEELDNTRSSNSKKAIESAKSLWEKQGLKDKGHDWKSFYGGYIEGYFSNKSMSESLDYDVDMLRDEIISD